MLTSVDGGSTVVGGRGTVSEASLAMRAETIQSRDGAVHVSSWGESGPPLLLLHGIGSRGLSWLPVVAELSREFQVVAPDLRGHGDSSKPGVGYRLADYADDLEDLL